MRRRYTLRNRRRFLSESRRRRLTEGRRRFRSQNLTAGSDEFDEEISNFAEDEIYALEQTDTPGCDIVMLMTEEANQRGYWKDGREASDFLEKYQDEAIKAIKYFIFEFGEDQFARFFDISEEDTYDYYDRLGKVDYYNLIIDKGDGPKLTFFMLQYGLEQIVSQMDCVQEVWNETIEIDEDFIDRFVSELPYKQDY